MGTTLTGTTPQDTYDSLIKVGDNGPLSGSLKVLSDGLGNDSTLSLSTAAASIAGTLAVTGDAAFNTDTLFVDVSAGNVGIGTDAPVSKLQVSGGGLFTGGVHTDASLVTGMKIGFDATNQYGFLESVQVDASTKPLRINQYGGHVGVGNITPAVPLDVSGDIRSSTGILFGTDTAAANALDDYEEGTWTMGIAFGGASIGVTTTYNTGAYTKIGRQVTVNGYMLLSNKGSSTGGAKVTGLPFTIANNLSNYSATSLRLDDVTFANQFQGFGVINTTTINLEEITELGVSGEITNADFVNNSAVLISLTYFV